MIFIKIKDKHIRIFAILLIYSNDQLIFTDPTNPDSDGDGLLDGEGIVVTYGQNYIHGAGNNGSSISAVYFTYKFNPKFQDNDGILDSDGAGEIIDTAPITKGLENGVTLISCHDGGLDLKRGHAFLSIQVIIYR